MKLTWFGGKVYLEPSQKMLLLLLAKRKGRFYSNSMRRLKHNCEIEVASKMLYQLQEGKVVIVKLPDIRFSIRYLFMRRIKLLDNYIRFIEAKQLYRDKIKVTSVSENKVTNSLISLYNTKEVRSRSENRKKAFR